MVNLENRKWNRTERSEIVKRQTWKSQAFCRRSNRLGVRCRPQLLDYRPANSSVAHAVNRVASMLRRIAILVGLIVAGCDHAAPTMAKIEPPVVLVAEPIRKPVVDYRDYTGRTEAPESVDVRARVNGYLMKINFEPGKEVEKEQVLFEIDSRPYQAALNNAKADIRLSEAQFTQADRDVKRNEPLVKTGATPQADFDKLIADRAVAAAQIAAHQATAEAQQLNVDFCKVTAPIGGRVGRNFITIGNLVAADQTLLTTIVSQDPMYVYFDVDEATVLRVQQMIREGQFRSARRHNDVPVFVGLASEPGRFPHKATINFVDNRIDPTTGTLKVRAELPNPLLANDYRLFGPGLFVRVRFPLGQERPAILISERAIGADQGQKFVYIVNDKNEVMPRPVRMGQMHDGLRVVEEGLQGGEKIIVVGLQRVRPGAIVAPKPGEMTPAADRASRDSDKK
jgi:RND family efflux transporter MFP subunit